MTITPNKLPFEIVKVSLQNPDSNGKRDAVVEFKDSKAVMEIFSQIPKASCTYAVEINPPVKSVSIILISYFPICSFKKNTFYNFFEEKHESKQALYMIMQGRL